MQVKCASCDRKFEAQRGTARYCGATCRKRASREGNAGPSRSKNPPAPVPLPVDPPSGLPLVEATRRELEAAGRLDTVLGQQAVRLAERMCSQFDTGSATASVSRELRAVMDAALAGTAKAADSLDELAARRKAKASGA